MDISKTFPGKLNRGECIKRISEVCKLFFIFENLVRISEATNFFVCSSMEVFSWISLENIVYI